MFFYILTEKRAGCIDSKGDAADGGGSGPLRRVLPYYYTPTDDGGFDGF